MKEVTEKKESDMASSELDVPQWSVLSFDATEASGLTYDAAVEVLSEREAAGVYGLCIVTDEAAGRLKS